MQNTIFELHQITNCALKIFTLCSFARHEVEGQNEHFFQHGISDHLLSMEGNKYFTQQPSWQNFLSRQQAQKQVTKFGTTIYTPTQPRRGQDEGIYNAFLHCLFVHIPFMFISFSY